MFRTTTTAFITASMITAGASAAVINVPADHATVQDAIDAPRISFAEPNQLLVEREIDEGVRADLARRGHEVVLVDGLGRAHGLTIEYGSSGAPVQFEGGADRRGPGEAKGF